MSLQTTRPWQEIDGFLTENTSLVMKEFIAQVPENGWIIEIGCFKGKQSAFIALSKKDSILLSCIDPFPDHLINLDDSKTYRHYIFADWVNNTAGGVNIEAVRTLSPFNISYIQFTKHPDLIIFDMDMVYDSLVFWSKHAADNTKILVHTYKHEHPRILEQVTKFTATHNFGCTYLDSLAVLSKDINQG